MSLRPYQFEHRTMCWGNTVEHCRDKGEISNAGEYNERYMETRGDSNAGEYNESEDSGRPNNFETGRTISKNLPFAKFTITFQVTS